MLHFVFFAQVCLEYFAKQLHKTDKGRLIMFRMNFSLRRQVIIFIAFTILHYFTQSLKKIPDNTIPEGTGSKTANIYRI